MADEYMREKTTELTMLRREYSKVMRESNNKDEIILKANADLHRIKEKF